jgi:hypothetical protein
MPAKKKIKNCMPCILSIGWWRFIVGSDAGPQRLSQHLRFVGRQIKKKKKKSSPPILLFYFILFFYLKKTLGLGSPAPQEPGPPTLKVAPPPVGPFGFWFWLMARCSFLSSSGK